MERRRGWKEAVWWVKGRVVSPGIRSRKRITCYPTSPTGIWPPWPSLAAEYCCRSALTLLQTFSRLTPSYTSTFLPRVLLDPMSLKQTHQRKLTGRSSSRKGAKLDRVISPMFAHLTLAPLTWTFRDGNSSLSLFRLRRDRGFDGFDFPEPLNLNDRAFAITCDINDESLLIKIFGQNWKLIIVGIIRFLLNYGYSRCVFQRIDVLMNGIFEDRDSYTRNIFDCFEMFVRIRNTHLS